MGRILVTRYRPDCYSLDTFTDNFCFHMYWNYDRIILYVGREGSTVILEIKDGKGLQNKMGKDEVRQELILLINDVMPELGEVGMDADITKEYGINSISIIRLIVAVEEKFDIKFSDYELSLDEYPTFGDLAAVVYEKLEAKDE